VARSSRSIYEGFVSKIPSFSLVILSFFFLARTAPTFSQTGQNLDQQFQSAVAEYHAGQYAEAATQLEALLPQVPRSFDVQELLGLVYAAQSKNSQAVEHLDAAVHLKPDSAAAHTNLAAALTRAGKTDLAGEQFRKAIALEPHDYDANHNLAEFYIQTGRIASAVPFLKEAQRIQPSSYDNGYDLALAYYLNGQLDPARQLIHSLLQQKDTGELHNLLGKVEEKDGQFIAAVNQFQIAATMDPSEDNLFDWGSEFLLHRTYEPAIDVFQQAVKHYPASSRLLVGLGISFYSRGKYDEAVKALLAAAALSPTDARCYFFLSKAYDSSPNEADEVIQCFRHYSELEPGNAMAVYYYAMSLWKGKRAADQVVDLQQVESLLKKATALDSGLPEAHAQLGNLYSDRHDYEKSIPEYKRALELNANLPDTHYRLGLDYVHSGHKDLAPAEFEVYQRLRAQHLAELDKEKAEVQQFVYSEKTSPSTRQ
jgi:tetratricopeptide (TPR) repeat protein